MNKCPREYRRNRLQELKELGLKFVCGFALTALMLVLIFGLA